MIIYRCFKGYSYKNKDNLTSIFILGRLNIRLAFVFNYHASIRIIKL